MILDFILLGNVKVKIIISDVENGLKGQKYFERINNSISHRNTLIFDTILENIYYFLTIKF